MGQRLAPMGQVAGQRALELATTPSQAGLAPLANWWPSPWPFTTREEELRYLEEALKYLDEVKKQIEERISELKRELGK